MQSGKIAGVYLIENTALGGRYIGTSMDIPRRWAETCRALQAGTYPNAALQRDWQFYGATGFTFRVLWLWDGSPETLPAQEQFWRTRLSTIYNDANL